MRGQYHDHVVSGVAVHGVIESAATSGLCDSDRLLHFLDDLHNDPIPENGKWVCEGQPSMSCCDLGHCMFLPLKPCEGMV